MHGGYRIAVRSCCHQCAVDVGEEPALHKSLEAGRHQTSMLLNATGVRRPKTLATFSSFATP